MMLTKCCLAALSACCMLHVVICSDLYMIDSTVGFGRRFDGIGGLSGGGATSKLLVNYPQEQRDQILDYLFKPHFGANLQILKVEIGGDAQSTDGTESSHMHYPWDENYERGYEWWLMMEAKKRNPSILLYCLPWAFPAWVGNGTRDPYHAPEITAGYIVKYILGAMKHYKLHMDYVGIWNERPYNRQYIKVLRKMLDDNGLQETRIVAADGFWEPLALDMVNDAALKDAVDFIGVHYPGTKGSQVASGLGKQLWSSEDYSTFNDNVGAGCWARILNQNYVNGNMTSTIAWNLIASYYEALPFTRNGLMTADSPWSGFYTVESPIWVTAHTTQFTWPGWFYYKQGYGSTLLKHGGSFVSIQNKETEITIVIETMSRNHSICVRPYLPEYTVTPQNITIQLKGAFMWVFKLDVWYSKLGFNGEPTTLMKHLGQIPVTNGRFSLSLGVDEMYTLTTLNTGLKGAYSSIPPKKPFPLPYTDNFDNYSQHEEPANFAPQIGTYEVLKSTSSSHGNVIRQMVQENPCAWCDAKANLSMGVIGNYSWYCRLASGYPVYQEPYNFAPQVGAFEVLPSGDSQHGQVMTQTVIENPIFWCLFIDLVFPVGIIGDGTWSDIYVETDVRAGPVNGTAGVFVAARINKGGCDSFEAEGVYFFLFADMIEVAADLARTQKLHQTSSSVVLTDWHNMGLLIKDGYAVGKLDGLIVFNITAPASPAPQHGFVGLGTSEYGLADYDNLKIMNSADGEKEMFRVNDGYGTNTHDTGTVVESVVEDIDVFVEEVNEDLKDEGSSQKEDETLYFGHK